jgi:hypothetical protein
VTRKQEQYFIWDATGNVVGEYRSILGACKALAKVANGSDSTEGWERIRDHLITGTPIAADGPFGAIHEYALGNRSHVIDVSNDAEIINLLTRRNIAKNSILIRTEDEK